MTVVSSIASSPKQPKNRKNERFFRCLVSEYTNFDVVVYLRTNDQSITEITVHEYRDSTETRQVQSLKIHAPSEFLHKCLATQYHNRDIIRKPAFTAVLQAALQKLL